MQTLHDFPPGLVAAGQKPHVRGSEGKVQLSGTVRTNCRTKPGNLRMMSRCRSEVRAWSGMRGQNCLDRRSIRLRSGIATDPAIGHSDGESAAEVSAFQRERHTATTSKCLLRYNQQEPRREPSLSAWASSNDLTDA